LATELIMCILLLSYGQHPNYPLVVAANREEAYARPTKTAAFWEDTPDVLAGRDLLAGGTWLGITRHGRFAALTNFRDPDLNLPDRPSRGRLVSDFLISNEAPVAYLSQVAQHADQYNGFSLIVGHGDICGYYSNRGHEVRALSPGLYGLSNSLLDEPWPKVTRGKQALSAVLSGDADVRPESLFALLADRTVADDVELPSTGVDIEHERVLSPLFVSTPSYGTRSSTVILLDRESTVTFIERSFDGDPERYTTVSYRFHLLR
ncbi:MAG: NRDE family protein, partial [Acidiferrobacterales bacterium]